MTADRSAAPGTIPVAYDRFLDCVHCGLCLEACPTYLELGQEADSPRGRIHLMRSVADGRLEIDAQVIRHLDLCLGCRACESACPSGVQYGALIEAARGPVEVARRPSLAGRLRRLFILRVLSSPARLRLALAPVRLLDHLGWRATVADRLPNALGRMLRLLPPASVEATSARSDSGPAQHAGDGEPVGLLLGCVVPVLYPQVLRAATRLLRAAGHRVIAPDGGCCGALFLHSGDPEGARRAARRTIDAFRAASGAESQPTRVVTTAAGCGAMMREYGHLLAGDPAYAELARDFAGRVADVSEVLFAAIDRLPFGPLPIRATYHDACHLAHGQGVRAAPRALLARIPGLELRPLAESEVCCGSAGSYNLTEPEMADRLLARKTACVLITGAELVVTGNPGCMLQMAAGLRASGQAIPVQHTVEVLARALVPDSAR